MSNVCGIWSMCVCVLCKSLYLCYTILSKIRCLYSNYILDCRVLVLYNIYKNFHFLALYMHFIFLFLFICSLIHWLVFFIEFHTFGILFVLHMLCSSAFFSLLIRFEKHIYFYVYECTVYTQTKSERERERQN